MRGTREWGVVLFSSNRQEYPLAVTEPESVGERQRIVIHEEADSWEGSQHATSVASNPASPLSGAVGAGPGSTHQSSVSDGGCCRGSRYPMGAAFA